MISKSVRIFGILARLCIKSLALAGDGTAPCTLCIRLMCNNLTLVGYVRELLLNKLYKKGGKCLNTSGLAPMCQ